MIVFHVDANSAYLSWTAAALLEQGYNKDIREVPSAIAGDPENRHGIILTKSAPAKKYGIKTGESIYEARKKYPELEVYPPDYNLYLLCSEAMFDILSEYTPAIQRYSVDECFCDMSAVKRARENPIEVAVEIKERIKNLGSQSMSELEKTSFARKWPENSKSLIWFILCGQKKYRKNSGHCQ